MSRGQRVHLRTVGWRSAGLLLAIAVVAGAAVARAVDVPHDSSNLTQEGCKDCHQLHYAQLPSLQGADCISCHASRGFTSWLGTDQATAGGTSGSSHNWSGAPTNTAAGATVPTQADMRTRVTEAGSLTCGACHDPHSQTDTPFDPAAPQTAGAPGRHFMLVPNGASEMCLDCHATWKQSTNEARQYTGGVRSHPVATKDGTTPLTLANAGIGGDSTYQQTPLDSGIRATVQSGSTAGTLNLEPTFDFAPNALANFTVRFLTGPYRNVQTRIASSATASVTLAVAMPAAVAAGTAVELDRAGSGAAYDVTSNVGTTADQLQDLSKSWPTSGNNSPTVGAASVTILSTSSGTSADAGKTCAIVSNTATVLSLQPGCLPVAPAGGAWAYRIDWRAAGAGTTTADGTTTTLVDASKTLWNTDVIAGLQVRFLPGNQVARVTAWDLATKKATFAPGRATAVLAGERYVLEPAQVFATPAAASGGGTASLNVLGTPWAGLNLKGLLVRFTKTQNAAIQGMVTRITSSTSNSLAFVALPAAVRPGDTFEIDLDGNTTDNVGLGGATGNFATGTVVCQSCHGVHYADSNATTYDDRPRAGDGHLLRRAGLAAGDDSCNGCHATAIHSSITTDSSHGTWGTEFTCGTCHQPHGTKNVYLVSETIAGKAVVFRDTTGAGATSFAAPSGVVATTQVCTVCHTKTSRSLTGQAYDWSQHYDGAACSGCHTHQGGFAGQESWGAVECTNCHNYGMRTTDTARAGTYHHVMEAGLTLTGANATSYPTNATPVTDATTDKTCVQCHVDHNLFRPDMNLQLGGAGRANNLRTRIGSAPPAAPSRTGVQAAPNDTSTFFGSADYLSGTPGGICMSCHTGAQTKDRTNQAPGDPKTVTDTLSPAEFAASAHAYDVTGTITNGTVNFTVACTKCHNSDTATNYQSGTNGRRFALHTSNDRRLRGALGQAAVQDDHGEDFCYRCHSKSTDAIGGAVKTVADNDWYATIAMNAGSQDVWTQMQKGTAGSPAQSPTPATTLHFKPAAEETPSGVVPTNHLNMPAGSTTSTNTLYLKSVQDESATTQPLPDAYLVASGSYLGTTTYAASTMSAPGRKLMSPTQGTTQEAVAQAVTTGSGYYRVGQFVSPPIATGFTWSTGSSFTVYIRNQEGNAGANAWFRYALYQWTAADGQGTNFRPVAEYTTAEISTTAGNRTVTFSSGANVTFAAGDKIVLEVEFRTASATVASTVTHWWGNATSNARLVLPGSVTFTYPAPIAGAWSARSMSPAAAQVAYESIDTVSETVPSGTTPFRRVTFVSPRVATATTLPAAAWLVNVWDRESSLNANARAFYQIYRLNSDGTPGPVIVPWTTDGSEMATTVAPGGPQAITTPVGSSVSLGVGDKIVLDLAVQTVSVATGGAYQLTYFFGSGAAANLVLPSSVTFDYTTAATIASSRHDVAQYVGKHSPVESLADISSSKHVECEDCHAPHAASRGDQVDMGRATAAGTTQQLTNGNATWVPNQWVGYTVHVSSSTGTVKGSAQIASNTQTQLNLATALSSATVTNDVYAIGPYETAGDCTTGTNASTIADTARTGNKAWVSGALVGWTAEIVAGIGAGQGRAITANNGTTVTVASAFSPAPVAGSRYVITKLPGAMTGATGVDVATWGGNWAGATTYAPAANSATPLPAATAQWQACFKCHSSANPNAATWGGAGAAAFTDLALEFNPNNESYHPVISALPATGNRRLAATALTGGWQPGQVMTCSDCHGADATAASRGPHGSSVKWMLNPATTTTKYTNWPYTTDTANGTSATTGFVAGTGTTAVPSGNFCFSCHVWSGGGDAHTGRSDHGLECVACHIRVPHGGKLPRLMTGLAAPARYRPDGNGNTGLIGMDAASRPASGLMGEANCTTTGSCGSQHTASGTVFTW